MAQEDYSSYTAQNNTMFSGAYEGVIEQNRLYWEYYDGGTGALYKTYPANTFTEDFRHDISFNFFVSRLDGLGTYSEDVFLWFLQDGEHGSPRSVTAPVMQKHGVGFKYWETDPLRRFTLVEYTSGQAEVSSVHYAGVLPNQDYHLSIIRDNSLGVNGRITAYIYTDPERTAANLITTMALNLSARLSFDTIMPFFKEPGEGSSTLDYNTGYINGMDLWLDSTVAGISFDFETWPDGGGVDATPTGWKQLNGTVQRDTGTVYSGSYSCKFIRSGTDCYLTWEILDHYAYRGKDISFKIWLNTSSANHKAFLSDGVETVFTAHTSASGWEQLEVTRNISASSTTLSGGIQLDTTDGTTYIDLTEFTSDGSPIAQSEFDIPGTIPTVITAFQDVVFQRDAFQIAVITGAGPSNLIAYTESGGQRLSWDDNSAGETGFLIERKSTSSGVWVEVEEISAGSITYLDTASLQINVTYYYRVSAQGTDFSTSNVAELFFAGPPVLTVVQNGRYMDLSWTDTTLIETGFLIEKSSGWVPDWKTLTTLSAGVTSFTDTSWFVTGVPYTYRVTPVGTFTGASNLVELSWTELLDTPSIEGFFANEGRLELLKGQFTENLYVGLWGLSPGQSTSAIEDTTLIMESSLAAFTTAFEIIPGENSGYQRILIPLNDWYTEPNNIESYINSRVVFNPLLENWGDIRGYFITNSPGSRGSVVDTELIGGTGATSADDRYTILAIDDIFNEDTTINIGEYLAIKPRITIY